MKIKNISNRVITIRGTMIRPNGTAEIKGKITDDLKRKIEVIKEVKPATGKKSSKNKLTEVN